MMKSIDTAPRDGSRVHAYANVMSDRMENAFEDWTYIVWSKEDNTWRLSPYVPGTWIDHADVWAPKPTD